MRNFVVFNKGLIYCIYIQYIRPYYGYSPQRKLKIPQTICRLDCRDYAELHCITNFSFLRGASFPEEIVERANELGYRAIAITDECS